MISRSSQQKLFTTSEKLCEKWPVLTYYCLKSLIWWLNKILAYCAFNLHFIFLKCLVNSLLLYLNDWMLTITDEKKTLNYAVCKLCCAENCVCVNVWSFLTSRIELCFFRYRKQMSHLITTLMRSLPVTNHLQCLLL